MLSEVRTVTKVATVGLFGNDYEVDPALVGRKVELVFQPFDLEHVEARYMGRDFGPALPQRIGHHSHPWPSPSPSPGRPLGSTTCRCWPPGTKKSWAGPSAIRTWGRASEPDQVRSYFGFTKMPFGKAVPPSALY